MTSSKGAVFYIVSPQNFRGTTKSTQKVLKQFYTFWGSNTVLFITSKSSVRDVNTGDQFITPVKIYQHNPYISPINIPKTQESKS